MVRCQLWMGSLEPYMTESFIITAFRQMGENPLSAKVIRNQFTGYCFIQFATDEEAVDAMHKLNSKPIPGSNPMARFRLNNATNNKKAVVDTNREFSVWVGDLSTDIDDYNLFKIFSAKFKSVKSAKVVLDSNGFSKGFAFVRFGDESDMKEALLTMNGYRGIGNKRIRICNAVQKEKGAFLPEQTSTTTAHQNYDPSTYWQNYPSWQAHYNQPIPGTATETACTAEATKEDDMDLIDHTVVLDIDKMNQEQIDQDCNLWDALESSKWCPYDALEVF